jgi:hypothetical protein
MRFLISAALVAAVVLTGAQAHAGLPAGENPTPSVDVTDGVTVADVRAVVADAGGVVDRVKESGDNGFTVETTFPDDRHPWFEGVTCKGHGEARVCTEYEISMAFRAKSAADARRLAPQLCFKYICAFADDDVLTFTRMDFTYGGVTRDHLTQSVKVMLEMSADQIEPAIWPDTAKPKP